MAMTPNFYGGFFMSLANKEVDFDSDAIKAMLVTSAYTFDKAHRYKSQLGATEITGTGYTAGGITVPTPAFAFDGANSRFQLTGGNLSWPGATWTNARQLILYDSSPATDATRPLIARIDFGADTPVTSSTFQVTWDALGIAYITL
ncbi:hypothetical protein [Nocardia sp. NPDC004711]